MKNNLKVHGDRVVFESKMEPKSINGYDHAELFQFIYDDEKLSRKMEQVLFRAYYSQSTTDLENFLDDVSEYIDHKIKYGEN